MVWFAVAWFGWLSRVSGGLVWFGLFGLFGFVRLGEAQCGFVSFGLVWLDLAVFRWFCWVWFCACVLACFRACVCIGWLDLVVFGWIWLDLAGFG